MYTIIIAIVVCAYVLDLVVELLNLRAMDPSIPAEFADVYDAESYAKSQKYLSTTTRFGLLSASISTLGSIVLLASPLFPILVSYCQEVFDNEVAAGLFFFVLLGAASGLIGLPFALYGTFVIEERFGFNKSTLKTFFMDRLKGLILGITIGLPIGALILWFFGSFPNLGWLYCWVSLVVIQLVLVYVAPTWLMPLFNKFEPLPDGELKTAIEQCANECEFVVSGIYTMDGSKRSTKANAFFTGIGKNKRIVLFDTLVEKHSVEELVAILAHEIGHFKHKHVPVMMLLGIVESGLQLFLLHLVLQSTELYAAFGIHTPVVFAGMFLFGTLYAPISMALAAISSALSRRNEFQADHYAATATKNPQALISGLKRLTADSLGNLRPHPFKVKLEYSHPPVIERIEALRKL